MPTTFPLSLSLSLHGAISVWWWGSFSPLSVCLSRRTEDHREERSIIGELGRTALHCSALLCSAISASKIRVAYHEEDLLVDTFNETSFIWQDVRSCFLITPHTFQNLDIAAADVEASLCPIIQSRPAPRCRCCILPAIHTSIPTLHLPLSLLFLPKKTQQNNITRPRAGSLTHSIQRSQICVFCDFVCSRIGSPSSPARAAARTRRPSRTPLACSLPRYSSISRIASSSISLRYSFIHHHFFIQIFAAVFIRFISRIASSSSSLLQYSFIHSFITTSPSSSLLRYSFVHLTHYFFIHRLAAVFIHPSPLLHPALCCGIHSFMPTRCFFIQLFAAIFIR